MKYTVNGEERTAKEFHIGKKLTIVVYRKVKVKSKTIEVWKDKFFGTGTTVLLFLGF